MNESARWTEIGAGGGRTGEIQRDAVGRAELVVPGVALPNRGVRVVDTRVHAGLA